MTIATDGAAKRRLDLVLDALRSWRGARDSGIAVQPVLHATLDRHRCGVLTPVFDSLFTLHEKCLGRRLDISGTNAGSPDARRLLVLLVATRPHRVAGRAGRGRLAASLKVAVRSARIMIALTLPGSEPMPA